MPLQNNSQIPDFSRHKNVGEEQVLQHQSVFKAQALSMDAFDAAYAKEKSISDAPLWVPLYLKVGLYCGWNYQEFLDTPYPVIKAINKHIDSKLENLDDPGTFLGWGHIFVTLGISKVFGGGSK